MYIVVVFHPAVIAAELLVCPAISDLVATFKTCGSRFSLFVARAAKSSANGYRKRKKNDLWPLSNLPHRTDT